MGRSYRARSSPQQSRASQATSADSTWNSDQENGRIFEPSTSRRPNVYQRGSKCDCRENVALASDERAEIQDPNQHFQAHQHHRRKLLFRFSNLISYFLRMPRHLLDITNEVRRLKQRFKQLYCSLPHAYDDEEARVRDEIDQARERFEAIRIEVIVIKEI